MSELVGYILILVAVFNVGLILVPYFAGRADLLTIRNFFLLGFTIYQVTSGSISLLNTNSFDHSIMLSDQDKIAGEYLIWVLSFQLVFLLSYRWGIGAKRLAKWTPIIRGQTREPVLWLFAFTLLGVAVLMRFAVIIPYVSIISIQVGTSIAAVAVGLGAWIWVKRPLNPAAATIMFTVLVLAIAIVSIGTFGRRPIVAITGCLIWGTYYARWRGLPPGRVFVQAALVGLIPIVLVAKFTAVRGQDTIALTNPVAALTRIAQGNTAKGLQNLLSGQECAAWSMWLMEVHPESFDYNHLHAFKYYFQFPVPRAIYPNKPDALAQTAWRDAGVSGKPPQYTIGPGVLGHAGAEGGYLVLLFYAAVLGLFIRYFDAVLLRAPTQPFVVLPIGASMGNILGLARGEVPNFAFEFTVGVLGSLAMLIVVAYTLKITGFITDDDFVEDDEFFDENEHDQLNTYDPQYANYGSESDPNP